MLHVAASVRHPASLILRPGEDAWGMPRRLEELYALCECIRDGREHVSIWTADIDAVFARLYVRDGLIHDPHRGTSRQLDATFCAVGLLMFRIAPWIWIRSTAGWVDTSADELVAEYGQEQTGEGEATAVWSFVHELQAVLGAQLDTGLKATAAATSHEVYRDADVHTDGGLSSWCPDTERADFLWRQTYFGSRCQAFAHGLVSTYNHAPAAAWTRRGGDQVLERGQRLYHVDIRAAYPAIMREIMADVWQAPVQLEGLTPLELPDVSFGGWAEVELTIISPEASILPVRRVVDGESGLTWPKGGAWRGIWPVTILQAGQRLGLLRIDRIIRGEAWVSGYRPLEYHSRRMDAAVRATRGSVRQALKRAGRALSGKLAQGRTMNVLTTLDALDQVERDEDGRGRLREGLILRTSPAWGDYTLARVQADTFPEASNPVWASEITARCIVRLAEAELTIVRAGGLPIYCDTDAWIFAADGRYMAPDVPLDFGPDAGQWRVESCPDWIVLGGPKIYFEGGHPRRASTWAGVPRYAQLDGWYRGDVIYERETTVAEQFGSAVVGVPGGLTVCRRNIGGQERDWLADANAPNYVWADAETELDNYGF